MVLPWVLASPLSSPTFAWNIEHIAITTYYTPPSLWLRYVDDTFCILDKEYVTAFHSHLNSICSSIQFTMENEKNSSLSFLDVLVSRKVGNKSNTTDIKPPPFTKSLLTLTDICTIHHIIPNTTSSLWSKHYSIA